VDDGLPSKQSTDIQGADTAILCDIKGDEDTSMEVQEAINVVEQMTLLPRQESGGDMHNPKPELKRSARIQKQKLRGLSSRTEEIKVEA
jgi:hypothetical protein